MISKESSKAATAAGVPASGLDGKAFKNYTDRLSCIMADDIEIKEID
jgi:hypothetical protein